MRWLLPVLVLLGLVAVAAVELGLPASQVGDDAPVPAGDGTAGTQSGREAAAPGDGPVLLAGRGSSEPEAPKPVPRLRDVTGVVLEAEGMPVAGASVTLTFPEGPTAPEAPGPRTTTDEDGRFRIQVVLPSAGETLDVRVDAEHRDLVATREIRIPAPGPAEEDPPEPLDIGELRLRARTDLLVYVERAKGVQQAAVYAVPLDEGVPHTPLRATLDLRGRAEFRGLPDGTWYVVAVAEERGRAAVTISLPRVTDEPLRLVLGPERIVALRVHDPEEGCPIPGATLRALPRAPPGVPLLVWAFPDTTPADGIVLIRGLAEGEDLDVAAEAPGYPPRTTGSVWTHIRAAQSYVQIPLRRARTVRWPIRTGPGSPPAAGTRVRIVGPPDAAGNPPPPEGEVLGEVLVVAGWGPGAVQVSAIAPNGARAILPVPMQGSSGPPVTFTLPVRVHVRLVAESGAPLEGWSVGANVAPSRPRIDRARTDENGRATLEGFQGGRDSTADVYAVAPSGRGSDARPLPLRRVFLDRGDVRFDASIPDVREVLVDVRIDGLPRLPPRTVETSLTLNGDSAVTVTREEERAVLRTTWRPGPTDDHLRVRYEATGLLPGTDVLRFAPGRPREVLRLQVELVSPGAVDVDVRPPRDGVYGVVLQRSNAEGKAWRDCGPPDLLGASTTPRTADRGTVHYPRAVPGHYRARDAVSGAVTAAFVVTSGDTTQAVLDLARAGWVAGRVTGPDGSPVSGAVVEVRGPSPVAAAATGTVVLASLVPREGDGSFTYRVTGDVDLTLLPVAKGLTADPPEGVVVRQPTPGVMLRLR